MLEGCGTDCTYVKDLNNVVGRIIERQEKTEERVGKLERLTDVNTSKLSDISKGVDKLDTKLDKLNDKLDDVDKRPMRFGEKILAGLVGGIVTFVAIEIIKTFLK